MGIMEKNMETTIMYRVILGLHMDNGFAYYLEFRVLGFGFRASGVWV